MFNSQHKILLGGTYMDIHTSSINYEESGYGPELNALTIPH
jgi:hypothetical protein